MIIGIDIRTLMDAQYSGVSEYTLSLIKDILRLDNYNEYRLFYNCFGNCPNIPEFQANNVKLIKYNYPNKVLNYLFFKFFNYPKIDQALGVDVLFMPHLNFIGMSAGAKSLITVHDLSFLRYKEFFSWRKNFWHLMIGARRLLKRFNQIVAISENTKRDIMELAGVDAEKIKVIYSGVDERYRQIREASVDDNLKLNAVKQKHNLPEKFILYLGTIEPRKNVIGIIKAYNELRNKNQSLADIKLIIAGGKGWKSKKIFKEWEKSEFKDDIKFLGYIDSIDKVYIYNLASVFVYPSFYEGFGFPPLEAMASGLPVVSSYASSLSEVVGDAALMVDPYNINDITRALEEILTDSNLRNKYIELGLRQAKQFSWEKTAKEYLEVFASLIKGDYYS